MRRVCDRYVMLQDGQVRFDGVEAEISSAESVVEDFFYGAAGKEAVA
jgi:ABC-type transporter Mla maintaining outer membrane lipid asymmetry ATPase subunit MlaF